MSVCSTKTTPKSRCPELLAKFCDRLLRNTALSRKFTSEQIEAKFNGVATLLPHVKNKHVFMREYNYYITRRFVLDDSIDSEKQENMVRNSNEHTSR